MHIDWRGWRNCVKNFVNVIVLFSGLMLLHGLLVSGGE